MSWKKELEQGICSIEELKKYIKIDSREESQLRRVIQIHPMKITRYYLSLIDKDNKSDPIRRIIIPSPDELNLEGSYDTSGEHENTKTVGLQHKYQQTALILSTNRCAAYCRFCFRKRLVGLPNHEILQRFDNAINYIKKHKEINNVLISGGDPLVLPTNIIENFLRKLSSIQHLDFVRFGSRIPVVLPDRISKDKALLNTLKKYSLKNKRIYIVTHFNHPKEITEKSINAIDKLINANIILNNQTVLLRGVNDNADTLAELQNKLVSIGVNPYYVFQCRPVKRVKHHFQVPLYRGCKVVENAKKKLNGHSKRFKYIMSHRTGKIEIVGIKDNEIYFKYHQAKNQRDIGKFFKRKLNKKAGWLDELD
jgi:KamA family protein